WSSSGYRRFHAAHDSRSANPASRRCPIRGASKSCATTPKAGTSRPGISPPMSRRQAELIPLDAAPVFAALGDATRLSLLSRLRDGRPRSIVQLTDGLGLTRQGVSKHLRVLEEAGMVSSPRPGRESRFVFEPAGVAAARGYLERASRQWDRALARLQAFVETR